MTTAPRLIAFLTADPVQQLLAEGATPPLVVQRQSWQNGVGAISAESLVAALIDGQPLALCIGSDVPEALAVEVSQLVDQEHPDVGVVMIRTPTEDLWRQAGRAGVRDIIDPDAAWSELMPALQLAADRGERIRASRALPPTEPALPKGKIIVVLSPKGGSGKTMVSANVAVCLAASATGEAVLVDLDCVFGDVSSALGLMPEHTVGQLASLPSFDSTTLKVFLTRHERSGLYVLAGSGTPEQGEEVTESMAGQIIDILGRDFAYIVIDTAAGLDERALAAIDRATDLVLMATMDITSIRNLGKEIAALDRLGLTRARRHFVLNRADARVGLEMADVEAALGMKVAEALPSSRLVPLAMNQSRTLVLDESDSPIAQQLMSLARKFMPNHALANSASPGHQGRKGLFSRRKDQR